MSIAWNRERARYAVPGRIPTRVPSAWASATVAVTRVSGWTRGMRVSAVSVFSVLAGRKRACGALAARTSPVVMSATSHEPHGIAGGAGTPAGRSTMTPGRPRASPPTTGRDGVEAWTGRAVVVEGAGVAPAAGTADAGAQTPNAPVAESRMLAARARPVRGRGDINGIP